LIVSGVVAVLADVALMVAVVVEFTGVVLIGNVPLLWPCGMVMLAGTPAAPLLLPRVTNTPPGPAGAERVTVPVDGDPPVTGLGDTLTPVIVPAPGPPPPAGLMVSGVVVVLAEVALMFAVWGLFTGVVVTVNVPVDWPAGMMMLAGTVPAPLSLPRVTNTPPGPAGAVNVTVPVEGDPPVTGLGVRVTEEIVP
jgi:hypothetical protein